MSNSLKGKIALVTGGTKGIGKTIAEQLNLAGAEVIVTARSKPADLAETFYFIATDHMRADSGEKIAKEILEKYGRIDIIINNAGANTSPGGGFSTLSDEHWNNEIQLNLMATVRVNKALIPTMIRQSSGVVINISTGAAKQPIWEMTMSYSAAKAALNAYSKALANELGDKGIRVNVVSPGLVKTPLVIDFIENIAKTSGITSDEATAAVMQKVGIPVGRMAEPVEIAYLVAFLCSDEGRYITGVNYAVDGGAAPTV